MNATRTAVLPRYRTENPRYRADDPARFRPALRVAYRAESPVAPAPAAAPRVPASPVTAPRVPALRVLPSPVPASPVAPLAATSAASPLRLTRRGRIVVAVLAALLVAGLSLIVAGAAQATSHTAAPGATRASLARVVVLPGQSLWSVAETADPRADTRLVIQQITQLNGLTGDTVFAGQQLWVPRG
jgi:hypothetical protein